MQIFRSNAMNRNFMNSGFKSIIRTLLGTVWLLVGMNDKHIEYVCACLSLFTSVWDYTLILH